MKNTIEKGSISFLIFRKDDKYIAVCKEFGFVEEAKTEQEALKRILNSAKLLLDTVSKNPRLEPSLNVGAPFRYRILFYVLPIVASFSLLFRKFRGNFNLQVISVSELTGSGYAPVL